MNKINNLEELRAEISRLESISNQQKDEIKKELYQLKENFKPINIATGLFSDLTGVNLNKKGFLKDGIAYSISLLLQQFILKSERKFENGLYSTIDNLLEKVRHFVNSFTDPEARRRDREEKK